MNEKRPMRKTLERCLVYLTGLMKMDSKNGLGFEPADESCEQTFDVLRQDCENVRELLQAMESEPVRKTIGNWRILMAQNREIEKKKTG